jgi:hypothetical protein
VKKAFTFTLKYVIYITYMKTPVSTRFAAKAAGISLMTLQRWIADGDIRPPKLQIVDGRATRLWDNEDLKKLRQSKEQIYCRGRGRRKGKSKG